MKDQYISFSALQLAGESDFIAWVTEGQHDYEWSQWLNRHPETQPVIEEGRRIVNEVTAATSFSLMPADRQAMWNGISSQLNTSTARPKQFKLISWRWVSLAAAAIALIFWITTLNKPTTILALAGEQKEIQLPESSEVRLNAGSSVTYNGRNFTKDREIHLKGEAFFKVQHGSKFTVLTEQGSVTVLGTSFNVIAWPDRFEVSCYTGKVKVT
ncbi:MAG TPA: FecR family protein, partial [Saprospiraceae bacterium]|nr:FecR family protein [Saprospiraceae bacterium]